MVVLVLGGNGESIVLRREGGDGQREGAAAGEGRRKMRTGKRDCAPIGGEKQSILFPRQKKKDENGFILRHDIALKCTRMCTIHV